MPAGAEGRCARRCRRSARNLLHGVVQRLRSRPARRRPELSGARRVERHRQVGGPYVEKNLRSLALEGRLVQIAFLQGSKVTLDLAHLMVRRQTITGSTLRPRPVADKAAIARNLRDKVWPLIEAGKVRPVIDRTFPLAEAAAAHRLMESSRHIGKILLVTG